MALRDWSASRTAAIWAAWLSLLLVVLLVALVVSPDGVRLQISPGEAKGRLRWLLAAVGGLALVFPPAVITYAWYLGRVRKWGEQLNNRPAPDRDRVV